MKDLLIKGVDEELLVRFKEVCRTNQRPMNEVFQDLMASVIRMRRLPPERSSV